LTCYPKYGYLGYLSTQQEKDRLELLQGTLDKRRREQPRTS